MATIISPTAGFDESLLQQLSTGHTAEQQIWLSGYLYGLALAGRQTGAVASDHTAVPQVGVGIKSEKVTILYGSQTGNSKKVAGKVAEQIRERGREIQIIDLNDYATKNLKEEKIVLLVISTQGEGDPPTAAEDFHRWLLGPRAPKLQGLQFSVCALGDKSYLKYCQTGKELDARLEALGATRLAERTDCDVDYEEPVDQWIHAVLEKLPVPGAATVRNLAHSNGSTVVNGSNGTARNGVAKAAELYDRKRPFAAPILEKIQLNGRGSAKETWHVELSLEGSGLRYEPGDSLGIYPTNSESLVREVLYAAMLNGNKLLTFNEKEALLQDILLREVELTVLTREVLEKYAQWTNSAKLKALLTDPAALKNFLWGRNVADLLREYPAALSEATLLTILRKMPPRLYSIASSLDAHSEEAHLTVAAVRYIFDGRAHQGVGSVFLADRLAIGETVPVFIERNEYFKLPDDDNADIIMVGPGTGVAPFRAFVEARSEREAFGKNWLFFGNPNFTTDFLYQTEWLQHLKRGTLDRLDVAFSRDQSEKIYVQHRLRERSKLIYERLENGAYFYVCGDKNNMASDVQQAVVQIIANESGKGEEQAVEYLKNLKKQRRFLEDVY